MSKKLRRRRQSINWKHGELYIGKGSIAKSTLYVYYHHKSTDKLYVVGCYAATTLGLGYFNYTLEKVLEATKSVYECKHEDFINVNYFMSKKEFLRRYNNKKNHVVSSLHGDRVIRI